MAYKKKDVINQEGSQNIQNRIRSDFGYFEYPEGTERYMVTNTIQGCINNKKINQVRGDTIYLNQAEYNVFKDFVLLIPKE